MVTASFVWAGLVGAAVRGLALLLAARVQDDVPPVEVTEETGGEGLTEIRTDRTTQAETRGAEMMTPLTMDLAPSRKRALRPTSLGRR